MIEAAALSEVVRAVRERRPLTRGQVAKRLKLSPTVVYNIETGRTRIKLSYFIDLLRITGQEPKAVLGRHLFSVKSLRTTAGSELIRSFRTRLKLSQQQLAVDLGYASASMIHHFEKGLREPDLGDLFGLMELARDNVRGLVLELCADATLAARFPLGREAAQEDWREYWAHFYISAIRQLMRTDTYAALGRYQPGYFAKILGISLADERHALAVLKKFALIDWTQAKPVTIPGVRIAIPKDTPQELLDQLKVQWLEFGKEQFLAGRREHAVLSVDALPVSEPIFQQMVQRIRDLQDEFHNVPLHSTDGFLQLSWLAAYVPAR